MRLKIMASILCATALLGVSQARAEGDKTTALVGVDSRENSWYSYAGLTHHFGDNAYGDGIIGRLVGFGGDYDYRSTAVPQNRVDTDYTALEALVGYQKVYDTVTLRGYLGLDYERHKQSPDNQYDGNRGTHTGAKVRFDVESDFAQPNYYNLIATYGSARDRYWLRGRAGHDFSGFVVGPEIIATGDRYMSEERYGVFLNVRRMLPAMLSLSAGQARTPDRSAGTTPYVTVELTLTF